MCGRMSGRGLSPCRSVGASIHSPARISDDRLQSPLSQPLAAIQRARGATPMRLGVSVVLVVAHDDPHGVGAVAGVVAGGERGRAADAGRVEPAVVVVERAIGLAAPVLPLQGGVLELDPGVDARHHDALAAKAELLPDRGGADVVQPPLGRAGRGGSSLPSSRGGRLIVRSGWTVATSGNCCSSRTIAGSAVIRIGVDDPVRLVADAPAAQQRTQRALGSGWLSGSAARRPSGRAPASRACARAGARLACCLSTSQTVC